MCSLSYRCRSYVDLKAIGLRNRTQSKEDIYNLSTGVSATARHLYCKVCQTYFQKRDPQIYGNLQHFIYVLSTTYMVQIISLVYKTPAGRKATIILQ